MLEHPTLLAVKRFVDYIKTQTFYDKLGLAEAICIEGYLVSVVS